VQAAFGAIAEELGVDRDRLHFLGQAKSEAEHRANLTIADVVLDTYPYNGATTTLETLWAGIPLVTRAGQQFSGRNSFAMLMQVGVEAGIAWSDRQYVEWGVRFGQDLALRQQVTWQLRRSRQVSPLWDGRGLTRDLEAAFDAMWVRYCDGVSAL
jgi:predicted O-linked N-acetylglucosamine transferase (SPINDLY family)